MRGRADTLDRRNGKRKIYFTLDNNQLIAKYRMSKTLMLEQYTMLCDDLKRSQIPPQCYGLETSFNLTSIKRL